MRESEEASGRCGLLDGRLALVTSVWPSEEMGSEPERNRDREGDSRNRGGGVLESAWKLRMHRVVKARTAWGEREGGRVGRGDESEEDLERGCEKAS